MRDPKSEIRGKGAPRSYVGLAARAGYVACGTMACQRVLRRGQAHLLLLARDCGTTTRLRFERLAQEASVPLVRLPEGADPGAWVGRPGRVVVAIKDRRLAQQIQGAVAEIGRNGNLSTAKGRCMSIGKDANL